MEPTLCKDGSARILVRMSGVFVALSGVIGLVVGYGAAVRRLTEQLDLTRGVVFCLTILVLGIAVILLRRWAVVFVSFVLLAFSLFVAWGCLRWVPFPWSIFLATFYVAILSFPAAC